MNTKASKKPVLMLDKEHDSTVSESQKPAMHTKKQIALSRTKRKILKHVWLTRIGLVMIVAAGILLGFLALGKFLSSAGINNYLGLISDFIFVPTSKIESSEGRVNFLILGKAGGDHTAPDLTDTIVLVSVSLTKPSVVAVSIPRDIWVPSIRAKVNSAYYWGKEKDSTGGLVLAKSTIEQIVGLPIHYGLVIDFSGFTKIIDVLGGIEVEVERGFVDNKYPIAGRENDTCSGDVEYKCRYETIEFKQGTQKMDGTTALKFVRSRNAEGDEGTDLARGARQEKVIAAIKNKVLSREVLFSPRKLLNLYSAVKDYIETDAPGSVGAIMARRILASRNNIVSQVVPEDYLVNPAKSAAYDNLYVFIPKGDSWTEVQTWIGSLVN